MRLRTAAILVIILVAIALQTGCKKKRPPVTGPALSVTSAEVTARRAVAQSHAVRFSPTNLTVYLYTFATKETFPANDRYEEDDFFVEFNLTPPLGRPLAAGEYFDEQIVCWIHCPERTYMMKKKKGSLTITEYTAERIAGELSFDDGDLKVAGPFTAPFRPAPTQ